MKPGCRWFQRNASVSCPFCEKWFGNDAEVTGCRDWDIDIYCGQMIGLTILAKGDDMVDDRVKLAVQNYEIIMGTMERENPFRKRMVCSIWCETSPRTTCQGQPRIGPEHEVRGVNYGGRFIPERYLYLPGTEVLFEGIVGPAQIAGADVVDVGLCDVGAASDAARHWIEQIFVYAKEAGLKVLLDFHAAPGGQTANAFTGCDQGKGNVYFETNSSRGLALQALSAVARLCARHGKACYGIELLNEPAGASGPWYRQDGDLQRRVLLQWYRRAIPHIRKELPKEMAIIINEWPAWLPWWIEQEPLTYEEYGRVAFSSHLYHYGPYISDQDTARRIHLHDLHMLRTFWLNTRHDVLVTEYALNGHGSGSPANDVFEYNSYTNWFVNQLTRHGIGSMVWNFDSSSCAWGPVQAPHCGRDVVDWPRIFGNATPTHGAPATLHI